MFSLRILSGLLATYLVAAPCLVLDHDNGSTELDTTSVAQVHDHGANVHEHDSESSEDEHCCDDLSSSLHAPTKEVPAGVFVAVIPANQIIVPYQHVEQHTALSRDGPLFEHARKHASTIVMLS